MAEKIQNGSDKLYDAHIKSIESKFKRGEKVYEKWKKKQIYKSKLLQDIRDLNLENSFIEEELDDQQDT